MKKLFSLIALAFASHATSAQSLTVTNNTNCTISYIAHAVDANGPACNPNHSIIRVTIGPRSSTSYTTSWTAPPSFPSPYAWHSADAYDATCGGTGNTVGTTYCSTYPQTATFSIGSCNTCPVGTTITTTWTDNGVFGGSTSLDFN